FRTGARGAGRITRSTARRYGSSKPLSASWPPACRKPGGRPAAAEATFFAHTYQRLLISSRRPTMSAEPDIKAIVRDKYGRAALDVVAGGAKSCCGADGCGSG